MIQSQAAVMAFILVGACIGGCGSGHKASLTDTSEALAGNVFVAPYDPGMGQVVLAVPAVLLSAPASARIGDLGKAVQSQLVSALSASPNLLVADRSLLGEIADEHELGDAGALAPGSRPEARQLAGARYLVKADVTELTENVVGNADGGAVRVGGLFEILDIFVGGSDYQVVSDVVKAADPSVGRGTQTVEGIVGIEARVVDVQTGLVVATARGLGKLTHKNTTTILGIGGLSATSREFSNSVIAQASRVAAQEVVTQLHGKLRLIVTASDTSHSSNGVVAAR